MKFEDLIYVHHDGSLKSQKQ